MTNHVLDRCKASLMAGAIGDGLGAPVEVMKIATILERFGKGGVTEFAHYDPGAYLKYAPCEQTGRGVITDDTCMTMATLAGFRSTWDDEKSNPIPNIHQAYLRWGSKQAWAKDTNYDAPGMIDPSFVFPEWFDEFCFSSGAGKGTIHALNTGTYGTLDRPMTVYDKKTDTMIASEGAGGMMRVAPVGWLAALGLIDRPFEMGCRVAAITHGAEIAVAASGALALLICGLARGMTWVGAYREMTGAVYNLMVSKGVPEPHTVPLLKMMSAHAVVKSSTLFLAHFGGPIDPRAFEYLSEMPGEVLKDEQTNLFKAAPILIQVLAICWAAQEWTGAPQERMRRALTLAVTQSGVSDTVGAIVGNVLGAQLGLEAVEADFYDKFLPISSQPLLAAVKNLDVMARSMSKFE